VTLKSCLVPRYSLEMATGGIPAEAQARLKIDADLRLAGWIIQDRAEMNLSAGLGIAVREVPMGDGRVDYLLYLNQKIVGVIEAKPAGTTLAEVHLQAMRYASNLTPGQKLNAVLAKGVLPFVYEASSTELFFSNHFDPEPTSRRFFNFQRPSTLEAIIRSEDPVTGKGGWRSQIQSMPGTDGYDLRPASERAIHNIENWLQNDGRRRALVQMATGAGKTRMAVTEIYRLLKFGGFKRVLFLVDRNNLGEQTVREFKNWDTPDDGRKFTAIYPVEQLTASGAADSTTVVVSTIQRVWAGLKGEALPEGYSPDIDDPNVAGAVEAVYSDRFPPESFDLIIVDECHRSIYGQWRKVLEYFDAQIIGLTATPTKQTLAFFEQNLVSEYTFQESVADEVNVGFDVYRIKTQIGEEGGLIEAGSVIPAIDKRTREQKELEVSEDMDWKPTDEGIAVESPNHIRLVLETFRDRMFSEIFPELNDQGEKRKVVPKTLIFAKSDAHAETIVRIVREVFNKGEGFAAKITYTAQDPADLINRLRTSPELRIAVTVDMVATGTDVKPLECVLFMRDVRSGTYFEQMKGRGARSITDSDFQAVTEQGVHKERFVIVDAIGVTEHDFVDVTVTDRVKTASLESLLKKAAARELTQDDAATLGARLSKLGLRMNATERNEIEALAGVTIEEMSQQLVRSVNPEALAEATKNAPEGTPEEVAVHEFVQGLAGALATSQALRDRLVTMHQSKYIIRDEATPDTLLFAGGVPNLELAERLVHDWKQYLEDNKDEITALQLLYSNPQNSGVTRKQLEELIATIRKPHQDWTPAVIWKSYELLNKTNRSIKNKTVDLVSLVRFTLGVMPELVPFADVVEQRYQGWLLAQEQSGAHFSAEQKRWLDAIKDYICTGVTFETPALDAVPFIDWGGSDGFERDFTDPIHIIDDLNEALSA
jgi:type I restriction enzyme R subunit